MRAIFVGFLVVISVGVPLGVSGSGSAYIHAVVEVMSDLNFLGYFFNFRYF